MEYKSQKNVAGVDEVGRGSLIGPVYAATVVFKKGFDIIKSIKKFFGIVSIIISMQSLLTPLEVVTFIHVNYLKITLMQMVTLYM